jgi:small subunit ribosomal protein S20e
LRRKRQRERKSMKKSKESGNKQCVSSTYRMTLRSKEIKPLESACAEIVARAKNQGYETKGPVRIPTKILRITTRKSPCGEGSKTWDRFEMRIHKRVIDIHCPSSVVKEITNFRIDPGVDVNLIVWKQ